ERVRRYRRAAARPLGSDTNMAFFFSSRRRHTRWPRDWSSDVCSSDLTVAANGTITVTDASAGTCQVTANKAGDGSFAPSSDTKTITLNKAAVTVTADAKTKVYGTNDPSLTYHITSGSLVGNDTFSGSLTRDPGDTVGTYNITQGSLALSSNYTLAFN